MHKPGIAIIVIGLLIALAILCSVACAEDQGKALIQAARTDDLKRVQDLLSEGANVDAKDDKGGRALDLAWKERHQEIEQLLRAHGAPGAQSVHERDGNIFMRNTKGTEIQLTSSGHDSEPSLSPNGALVVFVRGTSNKPIWTGAGDADADDLWVVNISSKKAERVLSSKDSNKHGPERMKEVLAGFSAPQFSQDSKSIYFLSSAWVTSGAVHGVDLTTKKERFISPGTTLKVIREGEYEGYLKVSQHRYYEGGGSYDCDYVLTPEGKEIKVIEDSCD